MYTACVFCTADLGRNEVVEHFPVGTRLAFDAARGLLWVVCRRCERWNLTPVEERWEAIEECERLFRDTRLRASSDNIGLARLRDGTDLVRIGTPLRPELAAWRYGDQFGRRRRRALVGGSIVGTAVVGGVAALPMLGVPLLAIAGGVGYAAWLATVIGAASSGGMGFGWPRALRDDDGTWLWLAGDYASMRLVAAPDAQGGWGVRVPYSRREEGHPGPLWGTQSNVGLLHATLTGPAALAAVRQVMPRANGRGARRDLVQGAAQLLGELGAGEEAFRAAAARVREFGVRQAMGDTGSLLHMPHEVRLALEMAAHEDVERRAMEGELAELERAWRDAAELAGIAESLVPRPEVDARLDALKRRDR